MYKTFQAIFPDWYSNRPSEEEILAEVERWIDIVVNVPDDFKQLLRQVACPYMREAYAAALNALCAELEGDFDDRLGGLADNCYKPYWPKRETSIRRIIKKAHEEQLVLESQRVENESVSAPAPVYKSQDTPCATASEQTTAEQPVIINGNGQYFAPGSNPTIYINA